MDARSRSPRPQGGVAARGGSPQAGVAARGASPPNSNDRSRTRSNVGDAGGTSFGPPEPKPNRKASSPRIAERKPMKGFNSPIVFVISVICSLIPAGILFFLQSANSVDMFVVLLRYDAFKPILFFLLGFEVYSCLMTAEAGYDRLQSSLIWLLIASCLWIRTYPQIPVFAALFLVPVAARETHRWGRKPEKNWKWVGHAVVVSMFIVVAAWISQYLQSEGVQVDAVLSPVEARCPSIDQTNYPPVGYQYVRTAAECQVQAVELGIVTLEEAKVLVPSGDKKGCCVYRNFTTGLLFSDGECPPPEPNMHYLCTPTPLPHFTGELYAPLRTALVTDLFTSTEAKPEPKCRWGYELMIDAQSASEVSACLRLEEWSGLYRASPWMLGMVYFLMASVAYLRGRYLEGVRMAEKDNEEGNEVTEETAATAKGVMIGVMTVFLALFLGVQIMDSFQTDNIFLRYYIQMLSGIVVVSFFWAVKEFELLALAGSAAGELGGLTRQLAELVPTLLDIEWVQAALVFFGWPLYAIVALYAYLSQWWASRSMLDENPLKQQKFSKVLTIINDYIGQRWHMPFLLDKAWLIALALAFVLAGAQLTPVGLSWLDKNIQSASLEQVIAAYCAFGTFMFMNPAAPGFPVYFFSGILVTKRAYVPGDPASFTWFQAVLIGIVTAMLVKLIACYLQMNIGRCLGRSQTVRHSIGIHSPPMRAIEILLKDPHLSLNKVGVLNGAPDFPTSVLCGLFGLGVPTVLFWTMPTIFIVVPAVVAGATVSDKVPAWETVFQMTFLLAVLFQGSFGFLAARAIAEVIEKHKDELLRDRPEDEDLRELDKQEARMSDKLKSVTHWSDLPRHSKVFIVMTGIVSMSISFTLLLGRSRCIRTFPLGGDYQLSLADGGLNGDFRNILYTPGAVCFMLLPIAGIFDMMWWASVWCRLPSAAAKSSIQMTDQAADDAQRPFVSAVSQADDDREADEPAWAKDSSRPKKAERQVSNLSNVTLDDIEAP